MFSCFFYSSGQEKYRSVSRQYLRKADGVIIMYDVTSEASFLHVRYWIDCIKVRRFFLPFNNARRIASCYAPVGCYVCCEWGGEGEERQFEKIYILWDSHDPRSLFRTWNLEIYFQRLLTGGGWRGCRLRAGGE